MIAGVLIDLAVGLLCVVFGLLVWKKQKVSLLHDYHYRNVKKADLPAYSRRIGIGLILIGAAICLSGAANYFHRYALGWIALILGFTAGLLVMNNTQKKYNGSWLG